VLALALVLILEVPAEPSVVHSPVRLDLHAGAGWRDDTVARPLSDATASGGAFSDLGLRAAWFPAAHLGLATSWRVGRFTLTPTRGVTIPDHLDQQTADGAGAIAARAFLLPLTAEGQVGYGYLRRPAPLVTAGPAGDPRLAGETIEGHGLYLAASLRLELGARLGLELAGEARPVVWGAEYAGTSIEPRWYAARGAATIDCFTLGRTGWSLLVSYELARTNASGPGVRLVQKQQQVGLGLRGTWLPPRPPPSPPPPPLPPAPPPRPALPAPGGISGVVHGQGAQPAAAWITISELGQVVRADDQGAFRFEVPPGQYTVTIEAEGYLPQSKAITVRPGEQHIFNLELQPVAP
jgi:hypothetical protein